MTNVLHFAGLDISKAYFDLCVRSADQVAKAGRFSNDEQGFEQAVQLLPAGAHCVMEATGPYYLRLACWLHRQGFRVSVINPLVIHRFAQMRLRRAKTDKADAALIACYAALQQPAAWEPPAPYLITLQQLEAVRSQLLVQQNVWQNQLEAFQAAGMMEKDTKKMIGRLIAQGQVHLQRIEQRMEEIIGQYHQQMQQQLITIPGIANKTAIALITITAGFTRFSNAKQLSAYLGLSPRIFESGSSVRAKARICKLGMSRIRAQLYVCSWSASRYNKACRDLYERLLAKGKAKKLALIAVANKLIKQAFAIATQNKPYLIPTL